jgi:hypothetical protein
MKLRPSTWASVLAFACLVSVSHASSGAVVCEEGRDWVEPPVPTSVTAKVLSAIPAPCPEGQVPAPIGYTGPKGSPGTASVVGLTGSSASSNLANYHYAGVYQSVDVASGASVQWGQFQPTLGFNDFHTLGDVGEFQRL